VKIAGIEPGQGCGLGAAVRVSFLDQGSVEASERLAPQLQNGEPLPLEEALTTPEASSRLKTQPAAA